MLKINCKLVTPSAKLLDQEFDMVVIPGVGGELGILNGHIPMVVALKSGLVRAYLNGKIKHYVINGGFAHINKNNCDIIIEEAMINKDREDDCL